MTTETKILTGIGAVTVLILGAGIMFLSKPVSSDIASSPSVNQSILVHKDSHQQGPKNAKVTLVEFGDYQCPACGQAYPTVKQLQNDYKDKVNFVFRNYPLPQHQNAEIAAEAAEAAGEQGKYFEMHDKLYENQNEWSESKTPLDSFVKYAQDLKLNIDQFKKAVQSAKFKNIIEQDKQDGTAVSLQYTPTFFLNGHIIEGAVTYDVMKSDVEALLNPKK